MEILINTLNKSKSEVRMNRKLAQQYQLENIRDTIIKFGYSSSEVYLNIDDTLDSKEIYISDNVIRKLKLPSFCTYNIAVNNNEITIGPFIGIIVGTKNSSLSQLSQIEIGRYTLI